MISSRNSLKDENGHGTAVSGIIGAARNDSQIMGVAFNSTLLALRTDSPGTCDSTGCSHYDTDIAAAVDVAVQNGAKVINLSLGGASPGSAFVRALARAADQGIIVVIAAGTEPEANPSDFRSAERRVGNEGISKCRYRWSPLPSQKHNNTHFQSTE